MITEKIPEYLVQYTSKQDPSLYTAIDHASWRYIMRVSQHFFKDHAHQKYLDGLKETGISTERIPLIEEMDTCLRRFGWRAVAVVGFIPPAVFLEFQSLGILVIACDMRSLEHLAYTPAPDIVHEAAGHAPIIADPEYRAYLRSYGQVARNAIYNLEDLELYRLIRDLSDLKEDPQSTPAQIAEAQKSFEAAVAQMKTVSEATQLSRMGWWTIEYGLIGSGNDSLIYGAGLLSSVGESYHCLSDDVKKIPLTVDCIQMGYDITRPQPQLFVTPDFATLEKVLEEFANTMAFRRGGVESLEKAKKARATTTTALESGIQISSTLQEYLLDQNGNPIYLKYQGPSQLSHQDAEISGHGPQYHNQGFGTALGTVVLADGKMKAPQDLSVSDLDHQGFKNHGIGTLTFSSGVKVRGRFKDKYVVNGKNLILSFESCTVEWGKEILFQPDWGIYDMACGTKVTSVSGGAADRAKFLTATRGYTQKPASQKTNRTPENALLEKLYLKVREIREGGAPKAKAEAQTLNTIQTQLEKDHPMDWLLRLELLELEKTHCLQAPWAERLKNQLHAMKQQSKEMKELIERGLETLK